MAPISAAMHSVAADRQLPLPGQLPLGSGGFQAADEHAFQFQQQQLQQQMGVQQQLDSLQAMSELREAQLKSSRPISPPQTAGKYPALAYLQFHRSMFYAHMETIGFAGTNASLGFPVKSPQFLLKMLCCAPWGIDTDMHGSILLLALLCFRLTCLIIRLQACKSTAFAGLEGMGQEPKQDARWRFDSSLPQRGGDGEPAQQMPGGPGGLPPPFISIVGAPPRSNDHIKRSTSADSLPVFCAAPVDEVSFALAVM